MNKNYKELEIKILNVDVEKMKEKLKTMGAIYKDEVTQHIITYDCYDAIDMYNLALSDYKKTKSSYSLKKIENIYNYIEPVINNHENEKIKSIYEMSFKEYLQSSNIDYKKLNSREIKKIIKECQKRFFKWARLRKNGSKIELTIKYIYSRSEEYDIDQVKEIEMVVNDFQTANEFLKELGYIPKKEQEKIRISYEYNNTDIVIDKWPLIEPYIEIEGKNIDDIYNIAENLGFKKENTKIMNTDDIYKSKGIILDDYSKMTFKEQIK